MRTRPLSLFVGRPLPLCRRIIWAVSSRICAVGQLCTPGSGERLRPSSGRSRPSCRPTPRTCPASSIRRSNASSPSRCSRSPTSAVRGLTDAREDRSDARARPAPVAFQELGRLLGRGNGIAEGFVERHLTSSTVEVADVQPVEVRGGLARLRGSAGLLRQLPGRDHPRAETRQLREVGREVSCPLVRSEELTVIAPLTTVAPPGSGSRPARRRRRRPRFPPLRAPPARALLRARLPERPARRARRPRPGQPPETRSTAGPPGGTGPCGGAVLLLRRDRLESCGARSPGDRDRLAGVPGTAPAGTPGMAAAGAPGAAVAADAAPGTPVAAGAHRGPRAPRPRSDRPRARRTGSRRASVRRQGVVGTHHAGHRTRGIDRL